MNMEIANLVIGVLSLCVNILMLVKVNDISKNQTANGGGTNKSVEQKVRGRDNTTTAIQ